MAASFNAPAPNNQIISDVNAIHELLGYLAQARPDRGTDYPEGSVRIVEYDTTNNLWAIQVYKDNAWDNVGRLYNNVRLLQGYAPSTSALANHIPVYNASGQLVGNITGNAPTATKLATPRTIQVGGILSSTAQNFDGSSNITIPVNQITLNNSADTAVNGTLTTAHGGTGRTDGATQDIVFESIAGTVKAKNYGNVGNLKHAGSQNTVDANTLTTTGNYMIHGSQNENWAANHWPINNLYHGWLRVGYSNGILMQIFNTPTSEWYRYSDDQGASWAAWIPISGNVGHITIYISKSGSDSNTGINSAYPVLTFGRAFQIADKLCGGSASDAVTFRIGAGEWGGIGISDKSYGLSLYPYDGQIPVAVSNSLPQFTGLTITRTNASLFGLLINGNLVVGQNSYVYVGVGAKRIYHASASTQSYINFASSSDATNVLELGATTSSSCFWIDTGGVISLGTMHIKQIANITATCFLRISWGGTLITGNGVVFDSTSYSFTGKKYVIVPTGHLITNELAYGLRPWLNALPGTDGDIYAGAIVNGMPYGAAQTDNTVDLTSAQTISGLKTFKSPSIIYDTTLDRGVVPTSGLQTCYQSFRDKNKLEVGRIQYTNGPNYFQATWYLIYASGKYDACLTLLREHATGKMYLQGLTPDASANDIKLPTCEWVRARLGEASNQRRLAQVGLLDHIGTDDSKTEGVWTIQNLQVNLPVFVLFNSMNATSMGGVMVACRAGGSGSAINSNANGGITLGKDGDPWYKRAFLLGNYAVIQNIWGGTSTDCFITIPSASTINIIYSGLSKNEQLVAYQ